MQTIKPNRFELGKNAGIALLIGNYPEELYYADNNPIATVGRGIVLRIQTGEEERDVIEIVMSRDQAKAIVKGLKMQIKSLKR